MPKTYTIGLDFGTDSVRSLLVDVNTGEVLANAYSFYPRWSEGKYVDASKHQYRQHPLDYIESMESVICEILDGINSQDKKSVIGIGVDTTGSTPCPVDSNGTPLSLKSNFKHNPNAMFHLWKDHTAINEAKKINEVNSNFEIDYLKYVGGVYSAEWYWAKIAHTNKVDKKVRDAAYTWFEHCDWIPFLLTGGSDANQIMRSRCAAGHKALWHKTFKGIPSIEFLSSIDIDLSNFNPSCFNKTYTSDVAVGKLSEKWAKQLGLSNNVIVSVGSFDAHMGAVGGQIEPNYVSKIIGTSTCDIMVAPMNKKEHLVKGICGQVDGSVIPGMLGLEAGQSAFGDVYAWYKKLLLWPLKYTKNNKQEIDKLSENMISELSKSASLIEPTLHDPVSIDWLNGRRTPDANQSLKGALYGLHLGTNAPQIFKSLVEATCFGSKRINERFVSQGINIEGVIALGGVAQKSDYVMQTLADILNCPIKVSKADQTCALGAAMFSATASGAFDSVEQAMKKMGAGFEKLFYPNPNRIVIYEQLYEKYNLLGQFIESNMVTYD
ncbi:MAG: ribulokinase [Spirochaetales bacterium]|jgi:L-ribulokinase|nr:ribulokinase [Spirochaetales bacterium]